MSEAAIKMSPDKPTRPRSASHLSDRQIGQAAFRRRLLTFLYLSAPPEMNQIRGYVVGMDSYHWMLACPVPTTKWPTAGGIPPAEDLIEIMLVHKGRADAITISRTHTLDREHSAICEAVSAIGQKFWQHCESTYAGH